MRRSRDAMTTLTSISFHAIRVRVAIRLHITCTDLLSKKGFRDQISFTDFCHVWQLLFSHQGIKRSYSESVVVRQLFESKRGKSERRDTRVDQRLVKGICCSFLQPSLLFSHWIQLYNWYTTAAPHTWYTCFWRNSFECFDRENEDQSCLPFYRHTWNSSTASPHWHICHLLLAFIHETKG